MAECEVRDSEQKYTTRRQPGPEIERFRGNPAIQERSHSHSFTYIRMGIVLTSDLRRMALYFLANEPFPSLNEQTSRIRVALDSLPLLLRIEVFCTFPRGAFRAMRCEFLFTND
jgi:hypothetical protein